MLALDYAQSRVHAPFFRPMFDAVRKGPAGEAMQESLLAFLDSGRVNGRTDDDKTLVLAVRVPDEVADAYTEQPV
jgi:hypothetical protein